MKCIKYLIVGLMVVGVSLGGVLNASADNFVVEEYIKAKAKYSGTFDLYDEKADQVRNLKIMEVKESEVEGVTHVGNFRDVNSGDTVYVNFNSVNGSVEGAVIASIEMYDSGVDPDKKFTDEEVLAVMKEYFDKRSKITGTFMQYDEEASTMRNLKFIEIGPKVRNFGKLFISTAKFSDEKAGQTIDIDITLVNKEGVLNTKTTKIKKVY
ncbi:MAG: hypothetical protein ACI9E5_000764 [Candidatus Omnitrophota bacterium]|jgi:hypothetical protein